MKQILKGFPMADSKIGKALIALAMLVQLAVPAGMIYLYETTLTDGVAYRFDVRPVDPYDPFRGRYVTLNFAIEQGNQRQLESKPEEFVYNEQGYIVLEKDDAGLAQVRKIVKSAPATGDYLKVSVNSVYGEHYSIDLPFQRFYAEESKAPRIERSVWDNLRGEDGNLQGVTAEVRVKNGRGVIAELYIGDQTIDEFLADNQ